MILVMLREVKKLSDFSCMPPPLSGRERRDTVELRLATVEFRLATVDFRLSLTK